ncbi:DEKNAAC105187 [Brettanomyces naardenensis]|uniref:DEKNAAC105187 n=1 Tax=Brettanomyces naardenensis TaxID=13370 RepID=A0A448YSY0_BRENA|nr:DEKNAAC105187 [Brettanomyces naardenensis]
MSYYNTPPTGTEYQQTSFASLLANASQHQDQQQQQQQQPQTFDSLSPSAIARVVQSPLSMYVNSNNNNNNTNSYATNSLPSSASSSGYQSLTLSSPQSSLSSLYSTHRARFMSSKGFELEDDIEFCPDIMNLANASSNSSNSSTPQTSPTQDQASPASSGSVPHSGTAYYGSIQFKSQAVGASLPRVHTPRVRKTLDIVNPHTGMRIESSKLSPQAAK